jgi:hypothetical protein
MTVGSILRVRVALVVAAAGVAAMVACGGDSTLEPDRPSSTVQAPGGTDSSAANTPPATSNGPVASVVVTPKQVSMPQGYYARLVARPLDAKGVLVADKRAQWRSSDLAIAVPSDTGIVYAKSVGTAKIYATVDGHTDSATITVTTPPPPPPPPRDTVPSLPPPVASFTLNVTMVGLLGGTDTLATEPIVGATIRVVRFAGVNGDSLNPSVAAGSALTNTRGEVSFKDLPGGYYSILATPPAGSPYRSATIGLLPPRTSEVNVRIVSR